MLNSTRTSKIQFNAWEVASSMVSWMEWNSMKSSWKYLIKQVSFYFQSNKGMVVIPWYRCFYLPFLFWSDPHSTNNNKNILFGTFLISIWGKKQGFVKDGLNIRRITKTFFRIRIYSFTHLIREHEQRFEPAVPCRVGKLPEYVSKIFNNALCFSFYPPFVCFISLASLMTVWIIYSGHLPTNFMSWHATHAWIY